MEHEDLKKWFNVFLATNDLTQNQLAEVVGMNDAYISAVKLGKRHISQRLLRELVCNYKLSQEDINFLQSHTRIGKKNELGKNKGE